MLKEDVIRYINENNLIGIRGGIRPRGFLDIWMVVVEGRIFARSWGLSERSWYSAFIEEGLGTILCGKEEVPVRGVIPEDLEIIGPKINDAYLTKYTSAHNRPYAEGISRPEHMGKTLELIPIGSSLQASL